MDDDAVYQYLKLILDYVPIWVVLLFGLITWLIRNPERLELIPKYVAKAKFGDIEFELREIKAELADTKELVSELEEENLRLSSLMGGFDAHAPVAELEPVRQKLKAMSSNIDDLSPVLAGLQPGADPAEVYAAAEILRARRDFSCFDALIGALDRIGRDPKLEDLRYHTVWTLASAVHKTVIAAVKHDGLPKLTKSQLERAQTVMQQLHDNPHVQLDRPDDIKQGIRGPASYALTWIGKGLRKYDR